MASAVDEPSSDKGAWFYLDRSGAEYGPFEDEQMRAWFGSGAFLVGAALLVRQVKWTAHKTVSELWPDGDAFARAPRYTGPSSKEDQVAVPNRSSAYSPPSTYPCPTYPPPPGGQGSGAPYGYGAMSMYGPGYGQAPWMHPAYPRPLPHPSMHPHPYGYEGHGRRSASRSMSGSRSRSRSPPNRSRGGKGRGRDRDRDRERPFKPHHASVPKGTDLHQKFAKPEGAAPTTAMLRNIPNRYMQESLMEEIDAEGFQDSYDFFYLPIDVRNNANVGYAFINFHDPKDLDRFMSHFEGYGFKRPGSRKVASVSAAVVQGLKQNLENLVRKRVAKGQHRPIVVQNGQRIDLEQAERDILGSSG